ncbi:hypothetical protein PVL29_017502 [Vitis rotundifolia]|uniref:Uncharacterized protein n=1 Tax=Vitis rotundifolia TaxID=103349 RepID=A0AA38ZBP4_VITRO|nr:hypothetical protein PVL29_017502 [Vitis rotundifolia]
MVDRLDEARVMYERLHTHPNALVSKKARQLMFGFQATTIFFEAFIEDKVDYSLKDNDVEVELGQAILYIIFLVSPIFIVLLIALQKGT